jgi:hypothetical protein
VNVNVPEELPQFPSELAPFAQVLQTNRGGAVPTAIESVSSNVPSVRVTDAAGQYTASLVRLDLPANFPPGAMLSQKVLNANGEITETTWTIDLRTNEVPWGPQTRTHTPTRKTIILGPGVSGSFSSAEEALQDLAKTDPAAAEHLRKVIDEEFGGQWPPLPPDVSPPPAI